VVLYVAPPFRVVALLCRLVQKREEERKAFLIPVHGKWREHMHRSKNKRPKYIYIYIYIYIYKKSVTLIYLGKIQTG
jgi:hypothetical protein